MISENKSKLYLGQRLFFGMVNSFCLGFRFNFISRKRYS